MEQSSCLLPTAAGGIPTDRERVIGELTRGREITDQLQTILSDIRDSGDASVLPARSLVEKILTSFTQSLSMLNAVRVSEDHQDSQLPPSAQKSEDTDESCKTVVSSKDRRGRYKRRRNSETQTIESSNLYDDGHAWRKYGQKSILQAKHPRSYFRCTHKFDQGCQATKYVQKVQDDPPLYRTTYHDHHTCSNLLFKYSPHHQIIMESPDPSSLGVGASSTILSFQSGLPTPSNINHNNNNNQKTLAPAHNQRLKKENKQECYPAGPHHQFPMNSSSSSPTTMPGHNNNNDYYHDELIPAAANFHCTDHDHGSSRAMNAGFSSGSNVEDEDDHGPGDVYSCTSASNHMISGRDNDLDHLMVASVFIDDDDDVLMICSHFNN